MSRIKSIKCQCPEESNVPKWREDEYLEEERVGMNHEPNECKCTHGLKLYKRNGKLLWLCSCCNLFGDEFIKDISEVEE